MVAVVSGNLPARAVRGDALFGIGLTRAPDGFAATAIQSLNGQAAPVLALDVPSGVNADTGVAAGVSVRADVCVEFIVAKCGLHTGAGRDSCGRLERSEERRVGNEVVRKCRYRWLAY